MTIHMEREDDGRWIAEVPGTLSYGQTREEAIRNVQALAFRVLADRIEHRELLTPMPELFQIAASDNRA